MKVDKELVAASTVPLVLAILVDGESYGYAIIERVRELSKGELEWTDGMLYPVLHWMEDNGYISSRWQQGETGRKRKYYTLRASGRNFLKQQKEQWLTVHETLCRSWGAKHA